MYKDISRKTKETLKKQQWAKSLSLYTVMQLIKNNPTSPLLKSYMNTCDCARLKIWTQDETTEEMKMKSTYCKNRWCYVCNRIRTAININHYLPQISQMGMPFFVTLTLPTCTAEELPERIKYFEATWRKIYNRSHEKRVKEINEKDIRLNGVRSMECTLRPDGMYHFHMHLIVDGWTNADWLVRQWLKLNPQASILGQDITKIYVAKDFQPATKGSLMEVFKYALKMSIKKEEMTPEVFQRMDIVFQAFKGKRLLSAFGNVKALRLDEKSEDDMMDLVSQMDEELVVRLGNDTSIWKWEKDEYDWVNPATGEMLIGESLPKRVHKIVKDMEGVPAPPNKLKDILAWAHEQNI